MNVWKVVRVGVAAALCITWLAGCVQTKTTPGYARAGDHIVIGLGGVLRNAGGEATLKPSDLNIVLTDANSVQHTLEARMVFKSYLDYSAYMNTLIIDDYIQNLGLTNMVPYDGGWFVVSPLTLPGQYESPLPLAVGPASVSVTSPKLTNIANSNEGDLTAVPIDIIPGTSAQDVDYVRQFLGYINTQDSFVISPNNLGGVTEVGGAFLAIDYDDDAFFEDGVEPVVVPSDHNPYVQMNYHVVPNGSAGTIYVALLNPAGFKTVATADVNSSYLSDLTLRMNYFSDETAAAAKANFSINTFESYYIGMNGDVIPGLTPVLTHAEDL